MLSMDSLSKTSKHTDYVRLLNILNTNLNRVVKLMKRALELGSEETGEKANLGLFLFRFSSVANFSVSKIALVGNNDIAVILKIGKNLIILPSN